MSVLHDMYMISYLPCKISWPGTYIIDDIIPYHFGTTVYHTLPHDIMHSLHTVGHLSQAAQALLPLHVIPRASRVIRRLWRVKRRASGKHHDDDPKNEMKAVQHLRQSQSQVIWI